MCILVKSNNTIKLVPISGGRPISTHINNCKLAPYRDQHLLFSETSANSKNATSTAVPDPNFFRYSKLDLGASLNDDDSPSDEQAEPNAPLSHPNSGPESSSEESPPPPPVPPRTPSASEDGARALPGPDSPTLSSSSGTGYRQDEPPGPPRTRAKAQKPGRELPPLPGLGHDRLPLERWLNKKKKQLQDKITDK